LTLIKVSLKVFSYNFKKKLSTIPYRLNDYTETLFLLSPWRDCENIKNNFIICLKLIQRLYYNFIFLESSYKHIHIHFLETMLIDKEILL
jgi:hypothetical protein